MEIEDLVNKDLIFFEDYLNFEEAFKGISKYLEEKDLVTKEYCENLINREIEYPTGIDLSVVDVSIPNVAIPHTESKYCKDTKVVIVKLANEIMLKDMIKREEIRVKYLFFILNKEGSEQTNLLSKIMTFVTIKENMVELENSKSKEDLYKIISQ